jgi:hypothetical protein
MKGVKLSDLECMAVGLKPQATGALLLGLAFLIFALVGLALAAWMAVCLAVEHWCAKRKGE